MDKNIVNITKRETYTSEMAKSAYDKLGFVDKIFEPISVIIDFGCADGAITRLMRTFYNSDETRIIGYDLPEIAPYFKEEDADNNIYFLDVLSNVEFLISTWKDSRNKNGKVLLVMNSVLHEIYNYMSPVEINALYRELFDVVNPDYVWVRDMFIQRNDLHIFDQQDAVERCENKIANSSTDVINRYSEFLKENYIVNNEYFPINERDMTHFLMKYTYENWDKEKKENYAILTENDQTIYGSFIYILSHYKLHSIARNEYTLPYLEYKIYKEMQVSLTHELGVYTHRWELFAKED